MAVKLLCFAGSSRKKSINKQLAQQACEIARELSVQAEFIDLADYTMPLYNGDDEEQHGLPAAAKELQKRFVQHDALLIASPEYNSSFSPLLKNTLDWISRPDPGQTATGQATPISPFNNKVAGLVSASPGGFGGLRGLIPLRMLLGNIGITVVPKQLAVPHAMAQLDENGAFSDEKTLKGLRAVIESVRATAVTST